MRKLGTTQQAVLRTMNEHGGFWYPGCGSIWNTASGTERIMESLVQRGHLTKSVETIHIGRERLVYRVKGV